MRRFLYSSVFITGAIIAFLWYCAALINWVQEYSSGYYAFHRIEEVLETVAIVAYTYLGIRFCRKKLNFLE
jgi:uncharacterized membrane protein YdjX (TVP38/TMEM64 family)